MGGPTPTRPKSKRGGGETMERSLLLSGPRVPQADKLLKGAGRRGQEEWNRITAGFKAEGCSYEGKKKKDSNRPRTEVRALHRKVGNMGKGL